jgi:hypothetical protein
VTWSSPVSGTMLLATRVMLVLCEIGKLTHWEDISGGVGQVGFSRKESDDVDAAGVGVLEEQLNLAYP